MDRRNIILIISFAAFLIILLGTFIFLLALEFVKQKSRLLIRMQAEELKFKQELGVVQYEVEENIFRIIGQEIHDNVGQLLTIAKMNLNLLCMEKDVPSRLLEVKKQVGQALDELSYLSNSYNANILFDIGLPSAIEMQFKKIQRTGLFKVSCQSENDDVRLENIKMIFLYRMVQQILNDTVKYSGATELSGRIFCTEEHLHIIIHNNGKGFFGNDDEPGRDAGLQSMRQRAGMIETEIDVYEPPGGGNTVHFVCKHNGYD